MTADPYKKCNRLSSKYYLNQKNYLLNRNPICAYCGFNFNNNVKNIKSRNPTLDHIFPISKGGINDLCNYQLLCHECNVAKGNSIPNDKRLKELKDNIYNRIDNILDQIETVYDNYKRNLYDNCNLTLGQLRLQLKTKLNKTQFYYEPKMKSILEFQKLVNSCK